MHRTTAIIATICTIFLAAAPGIAQSPSMAPMPAMTQAPTTDRSWTAIDDARLATGKYHDLSVAIADGYAPFALDGGTVPTCFDSPQGGMGVHYVKDVDGTVSVTAPEAMVYELTPDGKDRLVAVEYIVPKELVEDAAGNPVHVPELYGQMFHKHPTLPLYVLHAWLWEPNPDGMFADFNPAVGACPTLATIGSQQVTPRQPQQVHVTTGTGPLHGGV